MTKFIKTILTLRSNVKQPMLINVDEIVCVKQNRNTCLVTLAHADDSKRYNVEIDTPFDELWRQLRTNNLVVEP